MGGMDLLREPLVVVPGASTPIDITMRDDNAELEGNLLGVPANSCRQAQPRVPIYTASPYRTAQASFWISRRLPMEGSILEWWRRGLIA